MCRTSNALDKHRLEHSKKNLESMYNGEVQSAMMNSYARTTTLNWILDTGAKTLGELQNPESWGIYMLTGFENLVFKGNCYNTTGSLIKDNGNEVIELGYNNISQYTDASRLVMLQGGVNASILLDTGADTNPNKRNAANNIYDLAGNTAEWSTEKMIDGSGYRYSGGSFLKGDQAYPAIDNNLGFSSWGTTGSIDISSRPILYK